eukprot:6081797-Lingulodinium_polyedra.AAC.1
MLRAACDQYISVLGQIQFQTIFKEFGPNGRSISNSSCAFGLWVMRARSDVACDAGHDEELHHF